MTFLPWNVTAINRASFAFYPSKSALSSANDLSENLLAESLIDITQGKNQLAIQNIDKLLLTTPNFNLANLIHGDLLMAKAQSLQGFGDNASKNSVAIKDLQDEARVRLAYYLSNKNSDKLPNLLLAPNLEQDHVIVVDTDKSRLYVYKNDHNTLSHVADYYVTVGKNGTDKQTEGDKRTPIGVYFAGKKLSRHLADIYGDSAYPLSYPNDWDSLHNKKGSGIWLHGTPSSTYSRPPRASDGCIVLTNKDLAMLEPFLQSGKTPVIIVNNLKWLDPKEVYLGKNRLDKALDNWLEDWKSQDTDKYLSHYSRKFSSNGINYKQWSDHKTQVQASKLKVDISISHISMFSYPGTENTLVEVDFMQNYTSQNLSNKMQKRQYWVLENNNWKIIYEGAV